MSNHKNVGLQAAQNAQQTVAFEGKRSVALSTLPAVFTAEVIQVQVDDTIHADLVVCTQDKEHMKAHTTASCLLTPMVGDLVLLAQTDMGESYVLSVVKQAQQVPLKINAPHGICVQTTSFDVAASESVRLDTKKLHEQAIDHTQISQTTSTVTNKATYQAQTVHLVVDTCTSVFRQMTSRIQHAFQYFSTVSREVEKTERNRAQMRNDSVDSILTIDATSAKVQAKEGLHLYAKNTLMN